MSNYTLLKPHLKFSWILIFAILTNTGFSKGVDPEISDELIALRNGITTEAKSYLGLLYQYGGYGTNGIDCSALVQKVYKRNGVFLQRRAEEQAKQGRIVSLNELKSGDLVFFSDNGSKVNHVAIVIRKSERNLVVVHSTSSGGVMLDDLMFSKYWKKRLLYGVDVLSEK